MNEGNKESKKTATEASYAVNYQNFERMQKDLVIMERRQRCAELLHVTRDNNVVRAFVDRYVQGYFVTYEEMLGQLIKELCSHLDCAVKWSLDREILKSPMEVTPEMLEGLKQSMGKRNINEHHKNPSECG